MGEAYGTAIILLRKNTVVFLYSYPLEPAHSLAVLVVANLGIRQQLPLILSLVVVVVLLVPHLARHLDQFNLRHLRLSL